MMQKTDNHLQFSRATCVRLFVILLLVLTPALCRAAEAPAQQTSTDLDKMGIEELMQVEVSTVYGASKYEQTLVEAPASVTVITADEIKMYGHRNLAEILQSVRSFSMAYDRNYSYVGVRSFSRPGDYNTRMLLLIDGIRINDNVYDDAPFGYDFPLDVDLIERVEIIRGPTHAIYGSNAFFGVVNVITKRGKGRNGMELSGEAGSFDTYKGRLSYGRKFSNGVEALLSGSFQDSRGQNLYYGEFDTPAQNNGWAMNNDGERFGSSFLKLQYNDVTLEGGYLRRRKNIPTASYGTVFNTPLNKTTDTRAFLDLKYERQLDDQSAVMARVSYNSYNYDGDYLYQSGAARILDKDYSRGNAVGAELQVTRQLFQRHKLLMGAEVRHNFQQDQGNYDSSTLYLDDRRGSLSWALFAQDEFALLDNLVLYAGIRYDHFESFGSTFNPRLALVYSPLTDTTLKLVYGRAFRAPNAYELYYTDHETTLNNPLLKEETITSYEVILEQVLGEHLNAGASIFYNHMDGIISQTKRPDGSLIFENIDSYTTKGVEFELRGRWQNGLQGRASYTLQQARRNGAVTTVPNSPPQLAKLNLILPIVDKKVFLGLEEQFTDRRATLAGPDAPEFFITNVTIFSHNILNGLEVSASIYNLFDKRHGDPGGDEHLQNTIEQDGRAFRLKLTYAF